MFSKFKCIQGRPACRDEPVDISWLVKVWVWLVSQLYWMIPLCGTVESLQIQPFSQLNLDGFYSSEGEGSEFLFSNVHNDEAMVDSVA